MLDSEVQPLLLSLRGQGLFRVQHKVSSGQCFLLQLFALESLLKFHCHLGLRIGLSHYLLNQLVILLVLYSFLLQTSKLQLLKSPQGAVGGKSLLTILVVIQERCFGILGLFGLAKATR